MMRRCCWQLSVISTGALLFLMLACAATTQQTAPIQKPAEHVPDKNSVELGKSLVGLVQKQDFEQATIKLRRSMDTLNLDDCKFAFVQSGGKEADWSLLLAAAQSDEYKTGERFGQQLMMKRILAGDVVDYMVSTLINAPASRKLAFSAGFISVFPDPNRARDDLDTLWMWAFPSEKGNTEEHPPGH